MELPLNMLKTLWLEKEISVWQIIGLHVKNNSVLKQKVDLWENPGCAHLCAATAVMRADCKCPRAFLETSNGRIRNKCRG